MNNSIAALILMGGQNKRMNGTHKAFLPFNEKTFIESVLNTLSDFPKIYLSVDDPQKFSHLSYPLIKDHYDHIGPIDGISSALMAIEEDYLFVTACDMPLINKDFTNYLISHLSLLQPDKDCLVLQDEEGFFYPLGAIYSKRILPLMQEMIVQKNYRLQYLLRQAHSVILPLKDTPFSKEILCNINTPLDYKKLLD